MRTFTIFTSLLAAAHVAAAAEALPLELENKIPLDHVSGRIDHFAIDQRGDRLFVAELGNDSVDVIDLHAGAVIHRIAGLRAPQGIGFVPETGRLFVANAGDGSVRVFDGSNFSQLAKVDLKEDADNVRVNPKTREVVVGYGSGALAFLDDNSGEKKREVRLKEHPESFQIDPARKRIYVNVPDAREVAVIDLAAARQIAAWDRLPARANFPMTLLSAGERVAVVFRSPARLAVLDTSSGAVISQVATCDDADDVFFDARRDRLYVSCGEGKIDVYDAASHEPQLRAQIESASGARTGFFDSKSDRYYLAVRAGLTRPAEIWVYRPRNE